MQALHDLFQTRKPVIAMAHLGPLPGSPQYRPGSGIDPIIEAVEADLEALQGGGVDAVMFGNESDRPYLLAASPESLTAMAVVVQAVKLRLRVPFGVNYLWDPVATVALAVATGARFGREIFTGVYDSDMGLWQPKGAEALRLRASLGRPDLMLLFNINAEFAAPLGERPLAKRAQSAVFSSLADVVCVSGPMTGEAVAASALAEVKAAVPETPVFANTGVRVDNLASVFEVADGVVIGTHLKVGGETWNPVDPDRVRRFMDEARRLR